MRTIVTDFVPAELDATRVEVLEPLFRSLLERPLKCPKCLEKLLLDRSELMAAVGEAQANLYIAMTRRTDDAATEKAYLDFVREVEPSLRKWSFDLERRIVSSPHLPGLDPRRYGVLLRGMRTSVELFREENIPLETQLTELDTSYKKLIGAMMVDFDRRRQTMPQMARYQEELDRGVRERAWRASVERRLRDADAIDEIFDRMIALRTQVARNAGFSSFRDYQHRRLLRFDYTSDDCLRFQDAVEATCVPLLRRLQEERGRTLGVDPLRPWDLKVDLKGRAPLRPFAGGEELVARSSRAFHRLDAELGRMFDSLRQGDCLDLESRAGKAPGGYQYVRARTGVPFIFMNAAGLHRDLETMIHEAGHAFHSLLAVHDPLVEYRDSPIEFAEVASMSMELLTFPQLEEFYSPEDAARARHEQLEGVVTILPWIATIDAFQHWIYLNPGHSRAERTAEWRRLHDRFGGPASHAGCEEALDRAWQRQPHLFGSPFYYIEYGIAQLGALQLWQHSRRDPADAVRRYKQGLALGGSRPLPELFEASGLRFDLGPAVMKSLVGDLSEELSRASA